MNFRLPDVIADLSAELLQKHTSLKSQPSNFVKSGKLVTDRQQEWNVKFADYNNIKTIAINLERHLKDNPDAEDFIQGTTNLLKYNELLMSQERELFGMLTVPFNSTEVEKAAIKATKLLQGLEVRPQLKGTYPPPSGRQRAKS